MVSGQKSNRKGVIRLNTIKDIIEKVLLRINCSESNGYCYVSIAARAMAGLDV